MSSELVAGILALLVVITIAAGLHVATMLGIIAMAVMLFVVDRPFLDIAGLLAWNVGTTTVLVAIPLFILMGELLMRSGLTERLYEVLASWLNPLPGGLLHTNVAACAVFAAMSGSSAATAATISTVALPAFKSRRYSERWVIGSLCASGTLGILIPPSVTLIVYGVLMEQSIGQLYAAALLPGIISAGLYIGLIATAARLWPSIAPRETAAPWKHRLIGMVSILPILGLIVLVLGSIYAGIATPTEAASFGVAGAFVVAVANRRMNRRMLREAFLATASSTSMILLLLIAAFLLQFAFAFSGVPSALVDWLTGMELSQLHVILGLMLLYLLLGAFMETFAILVTTLPVILPLLIAYDINLIWFAILAVKLTEIGLITPPYGLNLFIVQGMRKRLAGTGPEPRMSEVYRSMGPFLVMDLVALAIILLVPGIVLWLPELLIESAIAQL